MNYPWPMFESKFLKIILICSLLLPVTSCGLINRECSSLKNAVRDEEAIGGILFGEYELQRERLLGNSVSESRPGEYSKIVVDLLNNYVKVQELILEKPQCLVKAELEQGLIDGIPLIKRKIARASESDNAAFLEMLGEIDNAYQSFKLWIK